MFDNRTELCTQQRIRWIKFRRFLGFPSHSRFTGPNPERSEQILQCFIHNSAAVAFGSVFFWFCPRWNCAVKVLAKNFVKKFKCPKSAEFCRCGNYIIFAVKLRGKRKRERVFSFDSQRCNKNVTVVPILSVSVW